MVRLFSSALFGLLLSCCNITNNVNQFSNDVSNFTYAADFSPAFLSSSRISIIKNENTGQIKLTVYNRRDTTEISAISYVDSVALTISDFEQFFNALGSISLLSMKSDSSFGFDGISIVNTYWQDSIKNTFEFSSPNKKSKEHKIVEAVIELSRQKFNKMKHQEYFESLEQYFDFGLPCKKISDNPYEIRIYGVLSANKKHELTRFIKELPSDRPILIDMTNFEGMGTMFYPLFKSLITRNKNIIWATNHDQQLREIGVDTEKIVSNIKTARQRMN